MQPRHLVIFTRYPTAGGGKRRLAAGIGTIQALRFQRVRLAILLQRLSHDPRWTTWLAITPDGSGPWPLHVNTITQGRGDLGQRLSRVTRALPRGPAVIIGCDIPGITSHAIASAFDALGNHDAVFGLAPDGGYWLIGLRRAPRLRLPYANVRWSSEHALADTIANLPGAKVARLHTLTDIDTSADLARHSDWARAFPPREGGRRKAGVKHYSAAARSCSPSSLARNPPD